MRFIWNTLKISKADEILHRYEKTGNTESYRNTCLLVYCNVMLLNTTAKTIV
jgi:hypothetical protein